MKFFIAFTLFFLASYILCQSVVTRNVQNSSSNSNGIQTDISTETVLWSNGSTVVTKTVTTNGQTTKTVFVSNDGSTPAPDVTLTGSSTNIQDSNGVKTETVVNTYSNATTVTIKTVTQGNTITKTITVAGPSGTNEWTSVTTGGSQSSTSTTGGSPSTPAPSTPAPAVSTPAPAVITPAPAVVTPSTSTATQNPITLDPSDIYSKYNYKVPSTISYADIRNIHLEYINGARDCMGIQNATWDDTIAAHAQVWANTCNIFHASDSSSPPNPFTTDENVGEGENIYNFAGSNLKATDAMVKGLLFFNGESSVYDCESNSCSGTCGHYTQNVWFRSTRIGCGVAECNGGFYGVCRYAARGNFNWPRVHPFGSAENCKAGVGSPRNQGYDACKKRIVATGRSLTANAAVQSQTTATNTNANKSAPFFNSDSQIVVFALAIVITVIVAACFVVLVVIAKRNTHKELDYQLLESK